MQTAIFTRYRAVAALVSAVVLTSAATADARLPGDARYSGQTEEGLHVGLRLGESGRHVARLRITYHVVCDDGAEGTPSTTVFDVRIRRGGRFSYRGVYRGRVDGSRNRVTLRGKVTRRVARGTFLLTATGTSEDSGEKIHCRSERVFWRAKRVR